MSDSQVGTAFKTWVRHAKDGLYRSEQRKALRSVDPVEQMRQMAASLRQSE